MLMSEKIPFISAGTEDASVTFDCKKTSVSACRKERRTEYAVTRKKHPRNLPAATRRIDCLQDNSTTAATALGLVPRPNLPKSEDAKQPQCPKEKEDAIMEALKAFQMIKNKE